MVRYDYVFISTSCTLAELTARLDAGGAQGYRVVPMTPGAHTNTILMERATRDEQVWMDEASADGR
jgi:hypothetical protein